jgi:hypothetical protein
MCQIREAGKFTAFAFAFAHASLLKKKGRIQLLVLPSRAIAFLHDLTSRPGCVSGDNGHLI